MQVRDLKGQAGECKLIAHGMAPQSAPLSQGLYTGLIALRKISKVRNSWTLKSPRFRPRISNKT